MTRLVCWLIRLIDYEWVDDTFAVFLSLMGILALLATLGIIPVD